jgi:hypothetical protein
LAAASPDLDVTGRPKRSKSLINRFKKSPRPSDDAGAWPTTPNTGESDEAAEEVLYDQRPSVPRKPSGWSKRKGSSGGAGGTRPTISAPISPPIEAGIFANADESATESVLSSEAYGPLSPPQTEYDINRQRRGRPPPQQLDLPSPPLDEKRLGDATNLNNNNANGGTLGRKTSMLQRMKGNFLRKSLSK